MWHLNVYGKRRVQVSHSEQPSIRTAFFALFGSDAANVQTQAGAESLMISRLIIRIYAQSRSAEIQLRCLNLID